MTEGTVPDWVKVKVAAVVGVGVPWLAELFVKLGPIIDFLIKLGQLGVAAATIVYIIAKWRKVRKEK